MSDIIAEDAVDYSVYQGKKVILVRNEPNVTDAVEIEGTVQSGNALGILIKPKGKTNYELVPAAEIEQIDFVAEKPKELDRKVLRVVEYGQARPHLLERHNWTLTKINETNELDAYDFHNLLDHVAEDLGHVHGNRKETEVAEAIAAEVAKNEAVQSESENTE